MKQLGATLISVETPGNFTRPSKPTGHLAMMIPLVGSLAVSQESGRAAKGSRAGVELD